MSRQPRAVSKTGMYHVLFRGVNHCHLFEESEDYENFLDYLLKLKGEVGFQVYAYCLMSNHVHIFLRTKENDADDLAKLMKRLLTYYAGWFNKKYQRSGSLIANRYKSECVEDECYLLELVRYIHQNPGKVGLPLTYQWSSYSEYINNRMGLLDESLILPMLSDNRASAIRLFKEYHAKSNSLVFEISDGKKKTEGMIYREIKQHLGGAEPNLLVGLPKNERDKILANLKSLGYSNRELERVTGISRSVIQKIAKI